MWEASYCRKTGTYHMKAGLKCQDQVAYDMKGNKYAIVLADGSGDSDVNVRCVSEIIEYTARKLIDMASAPDIDIWKLPKKDMVCAIMEGITWIISKYMKEYLLPASCFGSTLLAFLVDDDTDRYFCMHLGDGVIVIKEDGQYGRVLSYPSNSEKGRTVLTISDRLVDRVNIRRGKTGHMRQIALCSDGMYDHPLDRDYLRKGIWDIVDKKEEFMDKKDDQSFIQLRRRG